MTQTHTRARERTRALATHMYNIVGGGGGGRRRDGDGKYVELRPLRHWQMEGVGSSYEREKTRE